MQHLSGEVSERLQVVSLKDQKMKCLLLSMFVLFAALTSLVPAVSEASEPAKYSQLIVVTRDRDIHLGSDYSTYEILVVGSVKVKVYTNGPKSVSMTALCGSPTLAITDDSLNESFSLATSFCGGTAHLDVDKGSGQLISVYNFCSSTHTKAYFTPNDPQPIWKKLLSPLAVVDLNSYTP